MSTNILMLMILDAFRNCGQKTKKQVNLNYIKTIKPLSN